MQILVNEFQKEMKNHGTFQYPFLVSYERLSKYDSNSFFWHWHPEIELTLITEGQMVYEINNRTFHLKKGEALFGNVGVLHAGYMYENIDCEYISITFDPKLIYGYENSIFYWKYVSPITQDYSLYAIYFDLSEEWHKKVIEVLKEMVKKKEQKYDTYEIDIQIKLLELWKILILNHHLVPKLEARDQRNHERIQNIMLYIEQNYTKKIVLEDIAEYIHLCKGECCKVFKKYMKVPLFKFIQEYRIEKSIPMLIHSDKSVLEIANDVGFLDPNYYSHTFFKCKGCSPTKFRNEKTKGKLDVSP